MVMAAASNNIGSSGSAWSKWQIALAVGAPVAVGIGIWYLRNSSSTTGQDKDSVKEDGRKNTMASSAQTSLDMGGEQPKLPFEPVEEV
jgi:hypothetical protein